MRFSFSVLFLIIICSFGFTNAFGALGEYYDDEFGYSLSYPDGWIIDTETVDWGSSPGFDEGFFSLVYFYDDSNFSFNSIEVTFAKNDNIARNNSGQQYVERVTARLAENCEIATFEVDDYQCSDFKVLDTNSFRHNGFPSYSFIQTWTEYYPDGSSLEYKGVLTDILNGNDVWTIDGIADKNSFTKFQPVLKNVVDSFIFDDVDFDTYDTQSTDYNTFSVNKEFYQTGDVVSIQGRLLHDGNTPATVRVTSPTGTLVHIDQTMPDSQGYFLSNFRLGGLAQQSGIYTVTLDYADTQGEITFQYASTETPSFLTSYENDEYGFSFNYPNDWQKDILNEREPGVHYIADFYDSDSNVVSLLFGDESRPSFTVGQSDSQMINAVFLSLKTGCDEMTMQVDGMICYDPKIVDSNVFQIEDYTTVEIFTSSTLEDDDYYYESDQQTIVIFLDETKSLLITKSFAGISQNDNTFDQLIQSIKISKNYSQKNSSNYEIVTKPYVNEEFGFSVSPPMGWYQELTDYDQELQSFPTTIKILGVFSPPNSTAEVTPPRIALMTMNIPGSLDGYSEEEMAKSVSEGFLNGLKQTDSTGRVLSSDAERFENSVRINFTFEMNMVVDGIAIPPLKGSVSAWSFEDGFTVYYMYLAEPHEYKKYLNNFSESSETVYFKPQPKQDNGGGCLIATATYGSELSPEVQQLRELRDNSLLNTESGTSFMNSFNDVYYSFSPYIADYERENPIFKEMVKLTITPMISSLSLLNYVEMDSEIEVLGYGISLILLNVGMYVGIPAIVIMRIRK
jgi:hypothetical protein